MRTGRPSGYDPKYCDELIAYFDVPPYITNDKNVKEVSDTPTLAGFAASIGVHRETLNNWGEKNPDFFDALKRAKTLQENWVITNGMRGLVNTAFAIFMAKNVMGWRDRQELESKDSSSQQTSQALEEAAKNIQAAVEKLKK